MTRDLPKLLCRLKAVVLGDGKHAQEPFTAAEVVVANGCVVFLAGRVQNVDLYLLAVEDHLPKRAQEGRTNGRELDDYRNWRQ